MARKRSPKNYYFTMVHEQAIIDFNNTEDPKLRNQLYKEVIGPVLDEMVDKIVYTYKFTTLPNIDVLREDCKNWLITVLNKFDPAKGSKSNNEGPSGARQLVSHNPYITDRNKSEFFSNLKQEVTDWKKLPLRPNEQKTIQAIEILFDESENIDIFNKKAIYLYIREITGLNTKQVVSSLNKIRKRYAEFKKEWDEQ